MQDLRNFASKRMTPQSKTTTALKKRKNSTSSDNVIPTKYESTAAANSNIPEMPSNEITDKERIKDMNVDHFTKAYYSINSLKKNPIFTHFSRGELLQHFLSID